MAYAADLTQELPDGARVWVNLGLDVAWTTGERLTAYVADLLASGNWQRGGGKGNRPKPIPRPSEARAEQDKRDRVLERAMRFQEKQDRKNN